MQEHRETASRRQHVTGLGADRIVFGQRRRQRPADRAGQRRGRLWRYRRRTAAEAGLEGGKRIAAMPTRPRAPASVMWSGMTASPAT